MNQENQSADFGAFLAGFVIGGLVGAVIALVLAPSSGEETRAQLASQGKTLRDRINQREVDIDTGQEEIDPS